MFKSIVKKIERVPFSIRGFDGYRKVNDKIVAGAVVGTINLEKTESEKIKESFLDDVDYDWDTVSNWTPHLQITPIDVIENPNPHEPDDFHILSSAQVKQKLNTDWQPTYFVNPVQDLDYMLIEAALKRTFGGALMDSFTKFIMGTGFRPEIELINPKKGDDKSNEKELKKYQYVVDALLEIDRQVSVSVEGLRDVSMFDKVSVMINAAYAFNRSALIFSYDTPIKVKGKHYPQIPSGLKFAHPRDLGIIELDPASWKLKSVQWRMASHMVSVKDMIYLWNPLVSSKYHNGWFYGGSLVIPMLDSMKTLMRIIGVDFPAMANATWAGMFFLVVKPHGQKKEQKKAEYTELANTITKGGPNIIIEDPEDVAFHTASYEPRVQEFQQLCDFLIKDCVSKTGLPGSLFFDEASVNRSTMIGKIQLAKSSVIDPIRAQISRDFTVQWYDRWARMIFPKEMEKIKVKMVFDDLHVEEWFDKVEAVSGLSQLLAGNQKRLTIDALGELVGVENLASKVEDIPQEQGMPGGGGMPGMPGGGMPGQKPGGQMPGPKNKKQDKPVGLERLGSDD